MKTQPTITYRLPDGSQRVSHVDVSAWIPDPAVLVEVPLDQRLARAIDYAELAESIQSDAHTGDESIRECCQSDCWISHLDDAQGSFGAEVCS